MNDEGWADKEVSAAEEFHSELYIDAILSAHSLAQNPDDHSEEHVEELAAAIKHMEKCKEELDKAISSSNEMFRIKRENKGLRVTIDQLSTEVQRLQKQNDESARNIQELKRKLEQLANNAVSPDIQAELAALRSEKSTWKHDQTELESLRNEKAKWKQDEAELQHFKEKAVDWLTRESEYSRLKALENQCLTDVTELSRLQALETEMYSKKNDYSYLKALKSSWLEKQNKYDELLQRESEMILNKNRLVELEQQQSLWRKSEELLQAEKKKRVEAELRLEIEKSSWTETKRRLTERCQELEKEQST